jgi:hypothetical protein
MKQKILSVWVSISLIFAVGSTMASDYAEDYLKMITDDGFTVVSVTKTWLGRVQGESETEDNRRETVFNPLTGELLQDLIIPVDHVTVLSELFKIMDLRLRERRSRREMPDWGQQHSAY